MKIHPFHHWDVSFQEAKQIQEDLKPRLVFKDRFHPLRYIAGCDIALSKEDHRAFAGVIVYSWPDLTEVERKYVVQDIHFPYVPGFLSFREGPALLKVISGLEQEPDLFIFDGHGVAHPRGMGIASHMGLFLDKPAIGCGKSKLVGVYQEPGIKKGSRSPLTSQEGEVMGTVLRTRDSVKPVFISSGHKISLESAVEIVLKCSDRYRIPKPTREADLYVEKVKREHKSKVISKKF